MSSSRHTVLAIPATIKALQNQHGTKPSAAQAKESPCPPPLNRPIITPDALRRGTLTGSNVNELIEPDDVQGHKFGNVNETVESDDDVEGHARWKNADESDKA